MKAAVLYDTKWGNTEMIAKAIAEGIGGAARLWGGDLAKLS